MPVVPTTSGRQVQSRGVQTGGFQTFDVPQAGQVLANVADIGIGHLRNMYHAGFILRQGDECTKICDGFYFAVQYGSNG